MDTLSALNDSFFATALTGNGAIDGTTATYAASGDAAAEFQRTIHEAIAAVNGGEDVSVAANVQNAGPAPLVQGPYSKSTTDGVTYSLDEVCFTKTELAELRKELVDAGAPEAALARFDVLAGQPDGATLAQVLASLHSLSDPAQLTEDEEHTLRGLLGRIDPSGGLGEEVLELLKNGKSGKALTAISQAFADVNGSQSVDVHAEEIQILCKALGVTADRQQTILAAFQGAAMAPMTVQGFVTVMAPAALQFQEEGSLTAQVDAALDKTLNKMVSKARARMEKEKEASSLEARKVQRAKLAISRAVLKESGEILDDALEEGGEADGTTLSDAFGGKAGRKGGTSVIDEENAAKATGNGTKAMARSGRSISAAEVETSSQRAAGDFDAGLDANLADIRKKVAATASSTSSDELSASVVDARARSASNGLSAISVVEKDAVADGMEPKLTGLAEEPLERPEVRQTSEGVLSQGNSAEGSQMPGVLESLDELGLTAASVFAVPAAAVADSSLAARDTSVAEDELAGLTLTSATTKTGTLLQNALLLHSGDGAGDRSSRNGDDGTGQWQGRQGGDGSQGGDADGGAGRNAYAKAQDVAEAVLGTAESVTTVQASQTSQAGALAQDASFAGVAEEAGQILQDVETFLPGTAMRQLEEALSGTVEDGVTRMNIQLNPEDLGGISLVLHNRNGEVTALIRPEKAETAEMIERQVEALRISLEQQGVKVDRLEVQRSGDDGGYGVAGDAASDGDGGQNLQDRREELERLRGLATARGDGTSGETPGMERSVQDTLQTAIYATRTLNLVA